MKLRNLCLSLLMLPGAMFAENLTGNYSVKGYDTTALPAAPIYTGCATITRNEATIVAPGTHPDDYYTIEWHYTDFPTIRGTGVRKGDSIAFIFENSQDTNYRGVQLYKIEEGHKEHDGHHKLELEGPWILLDDTRINKEELTKIDEPCPVSLQ